MSMKGLKIVLCNLRLSPGLPECRPDQPDTHRAEGHAYQRSNPHYSGPEGHPFLRHEILFVTLIFSLLEAGAVRCLIFAYD